MCLYVEFDQKVEIAKKDITVYKHADYNGNGVWASPYRGCEITSKKLLTSDIVKVGDSIKLGFHSFTSKAICLIDAKDENSNGIFKCTIPAGSKLYRGFFFGERSIASDQIIYNEILFYREDGYSGTFKKPEVGSEIL